MFEACKNVENGIKWFITFKDLVNVDNFVQKNALYVFLLNPKMFHIWCQPRFFISIAFQKNKLCLITSKVSNQGCVCKVRCSECAAMY